MAENAVLVKRHFRDLRGSSNPFLAEATDGHVYVVKPQLEKEFSNLHFNEGAGTELYRAFGLDVPDWKPLLITDSFIAETANARVEDDQSVRLRAGLAFGSRFLGEGGCRLQTVLPGSSLYHIENRWSLWTAWMIDIGARHADNRQALFTQSADRRIKATFIDHGHLFGGLQGHLDPHFIASRYLDPRIYAGFSRKDISVLLSAILSTNLDRLWQRISAIPEEWKTAAGIAAFGDCLNRLQDAKLLESFADATLQTLQGTPKSERAIHSSSCRSIDQVLRPVIQGQG